MGGSDWYRFVLGELNGLGTMLRFAAGKPGGDPKTTWARVREVLETLSWDRAAALEATWAYLAGGVEVSDDVWGPFVVLRHLEPDHERVDEWMRMLSPEARAVIDETPAFAEPITGPTASATDGGSE